MNKFGAFVLGGAVGALAALAFAPRAGSDTRVLVVDKVNEVMSDIPGGSDVYDKAHQVYEEAVAKASDVVADIKKDVAGMEDAVEGEVEGVEAPAAAEEPEVVEAAVPVEDDKGDELRAKIEAARQRIASQVVKNAEAAAATAESVASAVTQAAAPAVEAEVEAVESVDAAAPAEAVEEKAE